MLLVDAYNVLHVTGVLPPALAGPDIWGLARLVARSRWGAGGARLVCDGAAARGPGRSGEPAGPRTVEVVFAGAGRDADGLIERMLQRESAPRRVTVVSSDRRLRRAARQRRARWMSSEAFLRSVLADLRASRAPGPLAGRPEPPLADGEVARWVREFGVGGDVTPSAPATPLRAPESPDRPRAQPALRAPGPAKRLSDQAGAPTPMDPLIAEALKVWPGRIDPDDLDMARWLDDHPPARSDGSP